MAPFSLEDDLDEFNARYWESCQEVMTIETCQNIPRSRLSSPLLVSESSKSSENQPFPEHEKAAGRSMESGTHDGVEELETRQAVAEMLHISGDTNHDTLHGSETGMEGHEEQKHRYPSSDGRSVTKVRAPRSKNNPKILKRQNLGNPFYRRGSAGTKSPVASLHQ